MEYKGASTVEHAFANFAESQSNAIGGGTRMATRAKPITPLATPTHSAKKALFYVDFIIRMNSGDVFLFDTKTENSDPEAHLQAQCPVGYMQLPENKGKKLHGGIIIPDDFGNWLYSPAPLDVKSAH